MIYIGYFFNTLVYMDFLILPSLAILAYKNTIDISLLYFISFFVHELGHILSSKLLDIRIESLVIGPYGGVINVDAFFIDRKSKQIILYISGILFNLILFSVFLPIGGLLQNITILTFSYINIIMLVLNLIPAYPWDGMKIVYILTEGLLGQKKATSICTAISLSVGVIFFVVGSVYFFMTKEMPLLVVFISVLIIFSTFNSCTKSKSTEYSYVMKKYRYIKESSCELKIKSVAVKEYTSIKDALKISREGTLVVYHVYSNRKNSKPEFLGEISELEILAKYIETGNDTTIGKMLNGKSMYVNKLGEDNKSV